jgi:hypothetical protein
MVAKFPNGFSLSFFSLRQNNISDKLFAEMQAYAGIRG